MCRGAGLEVVSEGANKNKKPCKQNVRKTNLRSEFEKKNIYASPNLSLPSPGVTVLFVEHVELAFIMIFFIR